MTGARERRKLAREAYKPDRLACLLVAEAPPNDDRRYFYFEDVPDKDGLFIEVTKALFPDFAGYVGARTPEKKRLWLRRLKERGFWLLDAMEDPLRGRSWASAHSDLLARLEALRGDALLNPATPIILIKANVFDELYGLLIRDGYTRVAGQRIPFPGSGQQKRFRQSFKDALREVGVLS